MGQLIWDRDRLSATNAMGAGLTQNVRPHGDEIDVEPSLDAVRLLVHQRLPARVSLFMEMLRPRCRPDNHYAWA